MPRPSDRTRAQRAGLWLHPTPNAIVYGSGRVAMRGTMRAGLWVNIVGRGVIMAVSAVTLRWLD